MNESNSSSVPLQPSSSSQSSQKFATLSHLQKPFTPNSFTTNHLHNRSLIFDKLAIFLTCIYFLLLHCYFQKDIKNDKEQSQKYLIGVMINGSVLTIVIGCRWKVRKEQEKVVNVEGTSLSRLVMFVTIGLIMPYSFLQQQYIHFANINNKNQSIPFKLNYLLSVLSTLKIFFILCAFISSSPYLSPRSYRLFSMTNTRPSPLSSIRSYFKSYPFSFITSTFLISVLFFSFSLRIAQHHFLSSDPYTAYMNIIWMTLMTMTTVGFGQMSPQSPLGRIVASVCVTWGVLGVSVMVTVISRLLRLDQQEILSVSLMKKLEQKEEVKNVAAMYLRVALWRVWKNYQMKKREGQNREERKIKLQFYRLRKDHLQKSKQDLQNSLFTQMSRQFQRVKTQIQYLNTNNVNMINYVSQQLVFKGGFHFQKDNE